jgi:hypothetical protein
VVIRRAEFEKIGEQQVTHLVHTGVIPEPKRQFKHQRYLHQGPGSLISQFKRALLLHEGGTSMPKHSGRGIPVTGSFGTLP